MKKIKTIVITYEVTDNYGNKREFDTFAEAQKFERYVKEERKVLDYFKPKGVTLIVSKDLDVFYNVAAGAIGFNGVPFCSVLKPKNTDSYYNSSNPVEKLISSIHGPLIAVLKRAYVLMNTKCLSSFDYREGSYHYRWNTAVGNPACTHELHPNYWKKGAYWYNWDGKQFTTNDPKCKITSEDLLK
jgi:hypothetical protein